MSNLTVVLISYSAKVEELEFEIEICGVIHTDTEFCGRPGGLVLISETRKEGRMGIIRWARKIVMRAGDKDELGPPLERVMNVEARFARERRRREQRWVVSLRRWRGRR